MLSPRSILLGLLAVIGLISAAQATTPRYQLVELPPPPNGQWFIPAGFDAQGGLVGTVYGHQASEPRRSWPVRFHEGRYRAVLNKDQTTPYSLTIRGLSATGDLVGHFHLTRQEARHSRAQSYLMVDGALTPWPGPDGEWAVPEAVNRGRQVVGYLVSPGSPSQPRAFSWRDGHWHVLPTPDGHTSTWANAINDRGQTAGSAHHAASGQTAGVLWEGGELSALFTLPGYERTRPTAINRQGWVVGTADSLHWGQAVFLFRDGAIQAIGPGGPHPSCTSMITGINDAGEVAMGMCRSRRGLGAGLYSAGEFHWFSRMLSASQAHWEIRGVHAINDQGDVAATAVNSLTGWSGGVLLQRRR